MLLSIDKERQLLIINFDHTLFQLDCTIDTRTDRSKVKHFSAIHFSMESYIIVIIVLAVVLVCCFACLAICCYCHWKNNKIYSQSDLESGTEDTEEIALQISDSEIYSQSDLESGTEDIEEIVLQISSGTYESESEVIKKAKQKNGITYLRTNEGKVSIIIILIYYSIH